MHTGIECRIVRMFVPCSSQRTSGGDAQGLRGGLPELMRIPFYSSNSVSIGRECVVLFGVVCFVCCCCSFDFVDVKCVRYPKWLFANYLPIHHSIIHSIASHSFGRNKMWWKTTNKPFNAAKCTIIIFDPSIVRHAVVRKKECLVAWMHHIALLPFVTCLSRKRGMWNAGVFRCTMRRARTNKSNAVKRNVKGIQIIRI